MAAKQRGFAASEEKRPVKIPQFSGPKKLSIFCTFFDGGKYGFELYLVEVISNFIFAEYYLEIAPRIRYVGDHKWEGCVLNSTLFIFEEFERKSDFDSSVSTPVKSVKKFDLSLENLGSYSSKIISIDDFEDAASMIYPKYMPVAVPTLNGKKILVFQSTIDLLEPESCFELYDPSKDEWTVLEPPSFPVGKKYISVQAYAFKDESTFLLITQNGTFVLYLNSRRKNDRADVELGRGFYHRHVVKIGDRLISPGWASTFGKDDGREFTLSPCSPRSIYDPLPFIALLDHKHGDRDAYMLVSQTQLCTSHEDDRLRLLIDVCRTDLDSLETNVVGTLKYIICGDHILLSLYMFIM